MFWAEKLINSLDKSTPHLLNDSKTPSGRVHVGSLRGVLIHDALLRMGKINNLNIKFQYGIDDYDPMDGLPKGEESLRQYMGMPLFKVPSLDNKTSDLAEYYIQEFLSLFKNLGVEADIYRMRDIYQKGQFNESIDIILNHADIIREIYLKVSKSKKSNTWYPFQVICENCGKLGTTEVIGFDRKEVEYICQPNQVKWAQGCGYHGKVSPYNGNGKLVWKLEWVAKWNHFGITVEGAGKDHCTKGGSRDIANMCFRKIFQKTPPLNLSYEFFLVEGAKMSSSKGIGQSAKQITDFLPTELIRYLMIITPPQRTVNFSIDEAYIIKIFNDLDRLLTNNSLENKKIIKLILESTKIETFNPVNIQIILTLLQLPHIDFHKEINQRYNLTQQDKKFLEKRIESVQYWLDHLINPEDKLVLQDDLNPKVQELSEAQKAFLNELKDQINSNIIDYQQILYDLARLIPINTKDAFIAIYILFFGKLSGPKAGNLLAFLQKDYVQKLLSLIKVNHKKLVKEVAIYDIEQLKNTITKNNAFEIKLTDLNFNNYYRINYKIKNSYNHEYNCVQYYQIKDNENIELLLVK